jgi:GTP cyclohydrolase IB
VKDVQSQPDDRNIPIDRVGVKNLRYPITVLDRSCRKQHTVASIGMFVNLPHRFRGTHMSRFVELLSEHRTALHIDTIGEILSKMKTRLDAEEAHMEVAFPYFIEKKAPASGTASLMEYGCTYVGTLGRTRDFVLGVSVPVTTVCPCSKEISDRGAHNQRSFVRIQVRFSKFVWIEELVEIAESAASCPIWPLLKRSDEKVVTERAYDHPRFVEDVVREVALRLDRDKRITWYRVESENLESIHGHNAFASIERTPGRTRSAAGTAPDPAESAPRPSRSKPSKRSGARAKRGPSR